LVRCPTLKVALAHGPGQPLDRFPVSPSPCAPRHSYVLVHRRVRRAFYAKHRFARVERPRAVLEGWCTARAFTSGPPSAFHQVLLPLESLRASLGIP